MGLQFELEGRKPVIEGFGGRFRHVPGYGICLDAPGRDVHFLPLETRVFNVTAAERMGLRLRKPVGGAIPVAPGSLHERQIVGNRLRRLTSPATRNRMETTERALRTPLGQRLHAQLRQWTVPPFNLLLLENGAISIRKGAPRLAVVHPDWANCDGKMIHGDLMHELEPWQRLHEALQSVTQPKTQKPATDESEEGNDAESALAPPLQRLSGWRPKSAPLPPPRERPAPQPPPRATATREQAQRDTRHRINAPPEGLDEDLAELVLHASREIRLERTAAFSHSVELRGGRFSVRFDPLQGDPPRLSVPFEVRLDGERPCTGFIWLWTSDPLTLVFTYPPAKEEESRVWAIVLLGFADLTVWPEPEIAQPRSATSPRRPSARHPVSAPRGKTIPRRRTTATRHRGQLDIASLRAHLVVAHRRWLPDGWDASSAKVREAAALGIHLEPGQTWVTSHKRGGSVGALRLQSVIWEPPALLERLLQFAEKPSDGGGAHGRRRSRQRA